MAYDFVSASLDETSVIVDFVNSAYRGDFAKKGWTTESDLLGGQRTDHNEISRIIKDELILLAKKTNLLCGCVRLGVVPYKNDNALYLGMLTVHPEMQSSGLGKLFIEEAMRICIEKDCKGILITVIDCRKELISFYERRGFVRTDKEPEHFPYGDERFGVPKIENLKFLEFFKPVPSVI